MKVFVFTGSKIGDGSFHYRILAPLTAAQTQGIIDWSYGDTIGPGMLDDVDVLVFHRLMAPEHVEFVERIRRERPDMTIIAEYDDDLFHTRPDNPIFTRPDSTLDHADYQATLVPSLRRGLGLVDRVIVSTSYLERRLGEETSTPISCLPNTIDEVLLEVPQRHRLPGEQLRVGWAGSPTHAADWRLHANGVRKAVTRAKASLTLMGADYRALVGVKDSAYVPWTNAIDQYFLQLSTWHIALAPLIDDPFNRSKSPIKVLEAGALAIPIVASEAGPYPDLVVDGETGFLCRTNADWERALRTLAFDEDARIEMGANARRQVSAYTVQEWAPLWVKTYADAIADRAGHAAGSGPDRHPAAATTV